MATAANDLIRQFTRLDARDRRLLNDYQHDFPLCPRPYRALGQELDLAEDEVIRRLARLRARGAVSRVGVVFRPHRTGASTLAALAVPPARLPEVARLVSGYRAVNHNYEREHPYNLWFVVTAADEGAVQAVLEDIRRRSGLDPLYLPMLEDFHIDLGFDLEGDRGRRPGRPRPAAVALPPSAQRCLVQAVQEGFPLARRPFAVLAARCGLTEAHVLGGLAAWLEDGTVKRVGVVVRHHELGYRANAMAVWDVPDHRVGRIGRRMAAQPGVTLCYRRSRHLPQWPYNLYCMVHGRHRGEAEARLAAIRAACGIESLDGAVLYSRRRFKQRGALYVDGARPATAGPAPRSLEA